MPMVSSNHSLNNPPSTPLGSTVSSAILGGLGLASSLAMAAFSVPNGGTISQGSLLPIGHFEQKIDPSLEVRVPTSGVTPSGTGQEIWSVYQQLNLQENEVFQRMMDGTCSMDVLNEYLKKIEAILSQKSDAIRHYITENEPVTIKSPITISPVRPPEELSVSVSSFSRPSSGITALIIEEQPYGNVVANKYLEPPIKVKVSEEYMGLAKEGSLQVTAVLCGSLTDARINRTSDGKQNILQGYTILPITTEGHATFNKLKIMDVSSKHHHQPFSIQLQLQEIKKTGSVINIGEPVKSAPLRVQSRINKKAPSRSNIFNLKTKKKSRSELDCNYIDITPLLVLPQKEAASKLGISESMLCKRFKECTRRKWPYRYLRKIDKMLQMFSPKSGYFNGTEDQEKIERLKKEREECLQPVKIRITGNDKVSVKLQSMMTKDGSPTHPSETESEESCGGSSQDEIESCEDAEISQVAETLNSLKQPTLSV
jgi:hypothetical protein